MRVQPTKAKSPQFSVGRSFKTRDELRAWCLYDSTRKSALTVTVSPPFETTWADESEVRERTCEVEPMPYKQLRKYQWETRTSRTAENAAEAVEAEIYEDPDEAHIRKCTQHVQQRSGTNSQQGDD